MTRVKFFYCYGTTYLWSSILKEGLDVTLTGKWFIGNKELNPNTSLAIPIVAGLNGRTAQWPGGPETDPFPSLLDPDIWDAVTISYPAMAFPMSASISAGITNTINAIKALAPGTPFAIGGYSQGAAVMSGVYNEIRSGSLTSRQSSFLGGVTFGNPRRQVNYRGSRGGTWSGAWDVPNSTSGGHGSFPTTGNYARLTNCDPLKWLDFTAPDDIFSSVGDSPNGAGWTAGNSAFLSLNLAEVAGYFTSGMVETIAAGVQAAGALGGQVISVIDALGITHNNGGNGHVVYPFRPPVGNPEGNLTSYQIALDYLNKSADQWATSSVILPETTPGWSTTLIPPGS
jgi:hypothetical protein